MKARPGTQRAYKAGEAIRMPRPEDLTDEQRKTLFGQTSSVVRNRRRANPGKKEKTR